MLVVPLPLADSLPVYAWREEYTAESLDLLRLWVLFVLFRDEMYLTGYCGFMETFFSALIMVTIITRCFETTVVCFCVLSISRSVSGKEGRLQILTFFFHEWCVC